MEKQAKRIAEQADMIKYFKFEIIPAPRNMFEFAIKIQTDKEEYGYNKIFPDDIFSSFFDRIVEEAKEKLLDAYKKREKI